MLKNLIITALVLLALVTGTYLVLNKQIQKEFNTQAQDFITGQTGLEFSYDKLSLDFTKLLQLQPSIKMTNIKLDQALTVDKVEVKLSLIELLQANFHIKHIGIYKPSIKLKSNAKGELILNSTKPFKTAIPAAQTQVIAAKPVAADNPNLFFSGKFSLEKLGIYDGQIHVKETSLNKDFQFNDVEVLVKDLELTTENDFKALIEARAKLLGSKKSYLEYIGQVGPSKNFIKTMPSSGDFKLELRVKDIPNDLRKEFGGEYLLSPESKDKLSITAKLNGDLVNDFKLNGFINLNNLNIGKNAKNHFKVNSSLNFSSTINAISKQRAYINIPNASLKLSSKSHPKGELKLNSQISYNLASLAMSIKGTGSLRAVEINEVTSNFSPYENAIAGEMNVNNISFTTSGIDALDFNRNLKASADIVISDGRLYLLENLSKYTEVVKNYISSLKPQQNIDTQANLNEKALQAKETKFNDLSAKVLIANEILSTNKLIITSKIASIDGQGTVALDASQKLNYDLNVIFSDYPDVPAPVKIRGTVEKPRFNINFKKLTQQNAEKAVGAALDMLLKGKFKF